MGATRLLSSQYGNTRNATASREEGETPRKNILLVSVSSKTKIALRSQKLLSHTLARARSAHGRLTGQGETNTIGKPLHEEQGSRTSLLEGGTLSGSTNMRLESAAPSSRYLRKEYCAKRAMGFHSSLISLRGFEAACLKGRMNGQTA